MLVFAHGFWALAPISKKTHFFDGGVSLCDRFHKKDAVEVPPPQQVVSDQECKLCHKRWMKQLAKAAVKGLL